MNYRLSIRNIFTYCLLPLACCALLVISSCDTPEKALKSTDIEYKKAKAISWYKKKEYYKCIPVFEELIGLMKGRQSTEDLYYMYADANYHQGDYMIAAYHFKNYYDLYPASEKAELCLYMYAKSYQQLSPKYQLDQTYTTKALDAYQLFLNAFSSGKYIKEVNEGVSKLRRKLELKALNAAELYYKTSNFKAAATSYANILKEYPDVEEREKVSFMVIKSNFAYAKNSIPSKKAERFDQVIKSFSVFKDKFSKGKYLAEAAKMEAESHYLAALSAYEWAEVAPLEFREGLFNIFFNEAKAHSAYIIDKKQQAAIAENVEKGYLLIVKSNYQASEEKKSTQKIPWLEQTIKTYYNFVDKFPKSRYFKEAERMYNNSSEQLKKLKTNG